jgi:hypothetical protein
MGFTGSTKLVLSYVVAWDSNAKSPSSKFLISSSFEKSHLYDVSGSGSTSVPCSESIGFIPSANFVASDSSQNSIALQWPGTNLISLLIFASMQMTMSRAIALSVSLQSANLESPIELGRSNIELRTNGFEFSDTEQLTADLPQSVHVVGPPHNLSRCLPDTINIIFSESFNYSEALGYSLGDAASHAFVTGDFADSVSFWSPQPYLEPSAARESGTVWAVVGGILGLLVLSCLILFLLWRRKRSQSPEDSDRSSEIGLGVEEATLEVAYDHEYWNPLMSDTNSLDEPEGLGSDAGNGDQEYDGDEDLESSGVFASEDNPLLSDQFSGGLGDDVEPYEGSYSGYDGACSGYGFSSGE